MAITLDKLKKSVASNLSFEEIFLTTEYQRTLQVIVNTARNRVGYRRAINLSLLRESGKNAPVGYTDGNTIFVNLLSPMGKRLRKNAVLTHLLLLGVMYHELGHVFWTDFDDNNTYMQKLSEGVLYPSVPNHKNAQRFVDALADEANRKILSELCHNIDNLIEDIYVNARQREEMPPLATQSINLGNQMIAEESPSIKTMKDKDYGEFFIAVNLLLTALKAHAVYFGSFAGEYKPTHDAIYKIAREHVFAPTHKERLNGINLIMCELWDAVEEILSKIKKSSQQSGGGQQQQSGSGQQQSGNGQQQSSGGQQQSGGGQQQSGNGQQQSSGGQQQSGGGQQQSGNGQQQSGGGQQQSGNGQIDSQKLAEAIKEAVEKLHGKTAQTQNAKTSDTAKKAEKDGDDLGKALLESGKGFLNPSIADALEKALRGTDAQNLTAGEAIAAVGDGKATTTEKLLSGETAAVTSLADVMKTIAQRKAEEQNANAVNQGLREDLQATDWGKVHQNCHKELETIGFIPSGYKEVYQSLVKELQPVINKLAKVVRRTIKEENLSGEKRRLYVGDKLDTSRMFAPDYKVWKNRKAPKRETDLAVTLLIDSSGSMGGLKIQLARLTAVLLTEVCEQLNVPIEIWGHSVSRFGGFSSTVILTNYLSFDTLNHKDKYALVGMNAGGCNRDGAALLFAGERLAKRKEQKKLLFLISDGRPNDNGYTGDAAKEDLQHIKKTLNKKGVGLIAAAIDSDKEEIHRIYGRDFLDITNLEDLPKIFGRILQRTALK